MIMPGLTVLPIERINAPSAAAFLSEYVRPRRPVVLRGLTRDWPARKWSFAQLAQDFGALNVPVALVRDGVVMVDPRLGVVRHPTLLRDHLDSMCAGSNDGYLTARADEVPDEFRRAAPPPEYCLGAPWQVSKLWLSAPGIVSGLHRDLADNLHAQVLGSKRFTLVDPRQSAGVYPNSLLASIPNGCGVDVERPDFDRFPRLAAVQLNIVDLEPEETIYIPRRWWHHVRTLKASLSINHWWARGAWAAVVKAADLAKQARGISR